MGETEVDWCSFCWDSVDAVEGAVAEEAVAEEAVGVAAVAACAVHSSAAEGCSEEGCSVGEDCSVEVGSVEHSVDSVGSSWPALHHGLFPS